MKKLLLLAILLLLFQIGKSQDQDVGINLRIDVSKQFKLNDKMRIELREQLQINPELKNLKTKKDKDIFNEIELFPYGDEDDDNNHNDDDDDDNDEEEEENNADVDGFDELNDARQRVRMEWRSATTADFDYKLLKWMRLGQSYSLFLDEDRMRHLFRSDVTFQPKLATKKLSIPQRLAFQVVSRERRGVAIWEPDFSARTGIEWKFKKRHELYTNLTVNGAFDEGVWEWDRFRCDVGLEYAFNKTHSFDFGYRFQQRLNRKAQVSHGLTLQYSVGF